MVAPFVLPLIPIVTAVGRFAAPYLVKELGKMGANKFAKTYGNEAFTSLNETLANNTPMVNAEAMPMVNPNYKSQQESKQNVTAFTGDLAIPGYIAPDAEAMEREAKKFREMLKPVGTPIEPPEIPIKTGEAIIPDIDLVEEFPAEDKPLPRPPGFGEGDKIEIPLITFSKDVPKDFKDIAKRSVGKEKGQKAVDTIFDDSIFDNVLTPEQIRNINKLEEQYVGDILDRGDPSVPLAFTNSMMQQYEEYFEDYKEKLAEVAKEKLGDTFPMYRLMKKDDALKMIIDQELPTIKKLDEDTNEVVPFTVNMMGEDVEMLQENMSFTLNPRTALGFKEIFDSKAPDEDFVLIEFKASPSDIVMRGHSGETDLVLNMGEAISVPKLFNFYDFKYKKEDDKIKGVDISENKEFKNFVQPTKDKLTGVGEQTEALLEPKVEFGTLTETEKQTAKALMGDQPEFFSRAVNAIKNAKQNKFTKGKWKSIVQSNSTKDEMDYLGLTEYLKGNESITKEELLKFVEKKDIAPNITVRSIPKDEMNKMYKGYSLGGYTAGGTDDTQEHIVFQYGTKYAKMFKPADFMSKHFEGQYGKNTFAHARTQVGFDPLEEEMTRYQDLNNEEIEKAFKNTLIIDEIQSDYIQRGQDKGFISDFDIVSGDKLVDYFKKHNISYKIYDKKDMQPREQGESPHYQFHKSIEFKQTGGEGIKPGDAPEIGPMDPDVKYIFKKFDNTEFTRWQPKEYEEDARYSTPEKFLQKAYGIVPDFPIKESKKFVELVLNKMIEKAVLDGRDSIAITNGQIQYNRYDAQQEEKKKGLKKFYDEIVFKQLEKISDKYNVELERIDISEGEAPKELQDIHLDNQIKKAQDDGYKLEKVSLQFLFDRTMDTAIPGHASIYSDRGVGQGHNYIEDYLRELVDNRPFSPATGTGSGLDKWNEIRNNEVYIWIKEQDISRDRIGWELPIVPVIDAYNTIAGTPETQQRLETLSDQDIEVYTQYLKGIEPPKGEEIGPEQLIKMKLPKKLQKERLSKPIKLTKAKQQTDRLFA